VAFHVTQLDDTFRLPSQRRTFQPNSLIARIVKFNSAGPSLRNSMCSLKSSHESGCQRYYGVGEGSSHCPFRKSC